MFLYSHITGFKILHKCFNKHTLYDPRSWTIQVNTASRPTGVVTLTMGALNFGSAEKKKKISW